MPECRRPAPCSCWGCISDWADNNDGALPSGLQIVRNDTGRPIYPGADKMTEGVGGDGDCD